MVIVVAGWIVLAILGARAVAAALVPRCAARIVRACEARFAGVGGAVAAIAFADFILTDQARCAAVLLAVAIVAGAALAGVARAVVVAGRILGAVVIAGTVGAALFSRFAARILGTVETRFAGIDATIAAVIAAMFINAHKPLYAPILLAVAVGAGAALAGVARAVVVAGRIRLAVLRAGAIGAALLAGRTPSVIRAVEACFAGIHRAVPARADKRALRGALGVLGRVVHARVCDVGALGILRAEQAVRIAAAAADTRTGNTLAQAAIAVVTA